MLKIKDYVTVPTIAPIRQVDSVPDTIDFRPSETRRRAAPVPWWRGRRS